MRIDDWIVAPADKGGQWGAMIIGDAEAIEKIEEFCQTIQEETEEEKNE